jgi:hypothetical protein
MAHRTVRCTTGHGPVRQPRHQAIGFRPLELCLVGPPDCPVAHRTSPVDCPVCHPLVHYFSARAGAHLMRCSRPLARSSRCSAGSPDSPVCTGHVWWIIAERIPEAGEFRVAESWGTEHCPVVHRTVRWIIAKLLWDFPNVKSLAWSPLVHQTVRCARPGHTSVIPCSLLLNPFLGLFIGLVWTFGTCITYRLEQTS